MGLKKGFLSVKHLFNKARRFGPKQHSSFAKTIIMNREISFVHFVTKEGTFGAGMSARECLNTVTIL